MPVNDSFALLLFRLSVDRLTPVRGFSIGVVMQIIDETVLQFRLPHKLADDVHSCIDKCEVYKSEGGDKELLMYWGQEETQRLV